MNKVYFARRIDGTGPIKIGCSDYPTWRVVQLSSDIKAKLELVAAAPGNFMDEGRLHRQFSAHRVHGEWFEPAEAVLAAIEYVKSHGKLPPAPDDDRDVVIKRRYLDGETLQSIGNDFGITRERVRQILRKIGVPSLGYRTGRRAA